ncbi:Protein SAWADEE homeodomain-like 2 [Vitis vinifera]|uniref:Protein SAWADEE homeodomain-like 2 n=1 Tax=Vitis vinifera TaxID=29760 RepID=A0A438J554_VITVI|nr:Protein SAWADEE homeodomain-like 2 [Vitis vinifera]
MGQGDKYSDAILALPVPNAGKSAPSDSSQMEFEAKSARDGAWYDVAAFLSHRYLDTSDPDVLVRFAGFGPEEDEWVNVKRNVRQRSLPCESSECVVVIPGDLILCFQEGKEQALYYDAHVLDAQRRRHDVRGCRCRFLVRYDHDQSEVLPLDVVLAWIFKILSSSFLWLRFLEIVPLRKVCRRPETDYRLQQLHASNESGSVDQQKPEPSYGGSISRIFPTPPEMMQKLHVAVDIAGAGSVVKPPSADTPMPAGTTAPEPKPLEISSTGNGGNPGILSENAVVTGISSANAIAGNPGEKSVQVFASFCLVAENYNCCFDLLFSDSKSSLPFSNFLGNQTEHHAPPDGSSEETAVAKLH